MSNYVKIAEKKDIPEGTGVALDVEGKSIALFNVGGTFHAMDNTCKHRGGPLGEGSLEGEEVICPWHGWQYNVTTGECTTDPSAHQKKYMLQIEGENILADLSE